MKSQPPFSAPPSRRCSEGHDVLAQAATGTGKTAAFALPLLHLVTPDAPTRERTAALVLVPTRELAMQVAEAIHKYGKPLGVIAVPIYGGASMEGQIRTLKRGVDVVVATPGRALDHIRRRTLHLAAVKMVVLDEADEMLDMGFAEDLEAILSATPAERQTALFSATLPPRISAIAAQHLRKPTTIRIEREAVAAGTLAKVRQVAYIVARANKMAALSRCARRGTARVDDCVRPHAHRGGRTHGGAQRAWLSRRGAPRRPQSGAARSRDEEIPREQDRSPHCHGRGGARARRAARVARRELRRAGGGGGVRAPHRTHRAGWAASSASRSRSPSPANSGCLRNIELLTKQKIEIAAVPTVADLRERRLDAARSALRETILAGGLEVYRGIVESLAAEFDVMDVAAAAVKRAESPAGEKEEAEIPSVAVRPGARTNDAGPRGSLERSRPPKPGSSRRGASELAGIYIGGGRKLKIRPGDIVGAIVNEAKLSAESIGSIQIAERHSTVLVPKDIVDHVIAALNSTSIKGKKLVVRRDRA